MKPHANDIIFKNSSIYSSILFSLFVSFVLYFLASDTNLCCISKSHGTVFSSAWIAHHENTHLALTFLGRGFALTLW